MCIQITREVIEATVQLSRDPTGIKYDIDKLIGTNQQIFSIVGPHYGHHYGNIGIIFRSEIMYHPDFDFTPMAGTSFMSGKAFDYRPWIVDQHDTSEQKIAIYKNSKIHPTIQDWDIAASCEMIGQVLREHKDKKYSDVTVDDILTKWKQQESHSVFEGHLPSLVSTDFIDKVIIPEAVYNLFTEDTKKLLHKTLRDRKDSLILTPEHEAKNISKFLDKYALQDDKSHYNGFRMNLSTLVEHKPLHLFQFEPEKNEPIEINFEIKGYDFFLVLQTSLGSSSISSPTMSTSTTTNRKLLCIYFSQKIDGILYIMDYSPTYHGIVMNREEPWLFCKENFFEGINEHLFNSYQVNINTGTNTLVINHKDNYHNKQSITFTLRSNWNFNELKSISIAKSSQSIGIRNFNINKHRQLLEIKQPQQHQQQQRPQSLSQSSPSREEPKVEKKSGK